MFSMRILRFMFNSCLFQDLGKIRLHFQQESILYEKDFLPIFSLKKISFVLVYGFTPVLHIVFIYLLNPIISFPRSWNTFHTEMKILGLAIKNNESNL